MCVERCAASSFSNESAASEEKIALLEDGCEVLVYGLHLSTRSGKQLEVVIRRGLVILGLHM